MNVVIKNANYERVMSVMERILRERAAEVCSCQRCLNDIAAIALNYLPPHYYYPEEDGGEKAESEPGSPWVMIETAVHDAMELVNELHHHDRGGRQANVAGAAKTNNET